MITALILILENIKEKCHLIGQLPEKTQRPRKFRGDTLFYKAFLLLRNRLRDSDGSWLEACTSRNPPWVLNRTSISLMSIHYLPNADGILHTLSTLPIINSWISTPIFQFADYKWRPKCGLVSGLNTSTCGIKDSGPCSSGYFFSYTKIFSFC